MQTIQLSIDAEVAHNYQLATVNRNFIFIVHSFAKLQEDLTLFYTFFHTVLACPT